MTTSTDTHTEDFAFVRRGYDPESVDSHLRGVESGWVKRLETAEAKVAELEAELAETRTREEAIHLTFIAATKTKEEMLETARRELEESRQAAKEESERIRSEAQYEAFRIVTDARTEAESAITEARREAESVRALAADEGASLSAARATELARLREEFAAQHTELTTRLERIRSVTGELEDRLRLLASGALGELTAVHAAARVESDALGDLAPVVPPATSGEQALDPGRTTSTEDPPTPETSPAVADEPPAEPAARRRELPEIDDTPATNRGSFYSRRSANLPRIGADAANAVAAVNAMRATAKSHAAMDEEDRAMRTA